MEDIEEKAPENDLATRLQEEINEEVQITMDKLTPQQRLFVDTYLFDIKRAGDFKACAIKAGYKEVSIPTLKNNERVRSAIEARSRYKVHNRTIDKAEAIANLRLLLTEARQAGNFPAFEKAVRMQLEVAGLLGDNAGQQAKVVNNTQINLSAEAKREIAGNLSQITRSLVEGSAGSDSN
mgnify:CR=1 FL=1